MASVVLSKSLVTVERLRWLVARCADDAGRSSKLCVDTVHFWQPVPAECSEGSPSRVVLRSSMTAGLQNICMLFLI